jgi:hypothetical protein
MATSRSRRLCRALLEETGGEVLRWVSITAVAEQLGLAADLDELDLVRVGGGHSVWLTQ